MNEFTGIATFYDYDFTYFGGLKNGKLDSFGIKISKENCFMGNWKNDAACGIGVSIAKDFSSRYEGEFKDGEFNGNGYFKWGNNEYRGGFQNGDFHGFGYVTYEDGTIYEGMFIKGKRSGKGKMWFRSGDDYNGEFLNGKKHGKGKYTFANGDWFEGEYVKGFRNGVGICSSYNYKRTIIEKFQIIFLNGIIISDPKEIIE